jgi:hypothetical protein
VIQESLDLGGVEGAAVVDLAQRYPHQGLAIAIFVVYVAAGLWLMWRLIRAAEGRWTPILPLKEWPQSVKALCCMMLIGFGLVHVFSLVEVYLQSRVNFSSAAEYFFYMSPSKLAATSHAHLFGHAVMYGFTGLMFFWTSVGERWKTAIIIVTLAGGLLDVPSWWMIKYAGGGFEACSILAAALSSVGFVVMAGRTAFEMLVTRWS